MKRLHTWDNAFNINMTVGNLISSIVSLALPFTPEFPTARIITCNPIRVLQICAVINYLSLTAIAVLRYWRLYRPGHIINKSKFVTGLVLPWSLAIFLMIPSIFHAKFYNVPSCMRDAISLANSRLGFRLICLKTLNTVGIGVITTCYVKIMIYYRHQCHVHVQTIAAVQIGTSASSNAGQQFVQGMQEFYSNQMNEDKRIVTNSILLVIAFYVTHMPNLVLHCCYYGKVITNGIPIIDYSLFLRTSSFAVNPVLYSMRN